MLISTKKKFVFLSNYKCASTSIESVLKEHCELILDGHKFKHLPIDKFNKYIKPLLETMGFYDFETYCIVRNPIDYVFSWYRYRQRDELKKSESIKYTGDITFDQFVKESCSEYPPLTRPREYQHIFVGFKNGKFKVDNVYTLDNIKLFSKSIYDRYNIDINIPNKNVSPKRNFSLSDESWVLFKETFKNDIQMYEFLNGEI
jgi:hypothetical protein